MDKDNIDYIYMCEGSLRSSIVQIISSNNEVKGAGFLLSKNGLIVTCAHVILNASSKPGEKVSIQLLDQQSKHYADVLNEGWSDKDKNDLAFLSVDEKITDEMTSVTLGSSNDTNGHSISTFGFPILRDVDGKIMFDGAWAEGR